MTGAARQRLQARIPLMASLLTLVLAGHASGGQQAISSAAMDDTSITIAVPVDIVGGDVELVAEWAAGIDRVWNHGNQGEPYAVCGRTLHFEALFAPRAAEGMRRPAHVVYVQDAAPGRPGVSSVWHALGTSPTYSARTGFWSRTMDGQVAAHEFGHLLGLLDEYLESDANRNGMREPGETTRPDVTRYSDAPFSLMAFEDGVVLERHLREILRMHGLARAARCK